MKLVKFTQPTCQPCKVLDMMLGQMGAVPDEVRVLKDDAELEAADKEFGVMGTPTMILFNDAGEEVHRVVGIHPPSVQNILKLAEKL